MADDDRILPALKLRAPSANQHGCFHLTDIVRTAAMLAGSADPIHKLTDAFHKFIKLIGKSQWHPEMTNIRKITTGTADKALSTTPDVC